jgi:3-hydroxyacyl-CoA dehydrogenase
MTNLAAPRPRIGIVGCGTIGCSWAAAFARSGLAVTVFDASTQARTAALPLIESMLGETESGTRGEPPGSIQVCESLAEAVAHADYVQESVTENLEAKQQVFNEMANAAPPNCVLASSTSALPPSHFLATLVHRERALVAHPFNPPHLVPLVEVVPSPWTDAGVTKRAVALLRDIGQEPILVRREIAGFVGNRLQAAVICEAIHLVGRGVISPEDLDKCMVFGLARRWAFMGPFQTMALNSLWGFGDYVRKYRSAYMELARSLNLTEEWSDEVIDEIEHYLTNADSVHPGYLDRRVRDKKLASLRRFCAESL